MSNIISLSRHVPAKTTEARCAGLATTFASCRRVMEDVFWLKENAEFLSIMESTGTAMSPDALAPYQNIYDTAQERLAFFPQYYRFLVSIILDLEDLGFAGDRPETGRILCKQVKERGLHEAELSDLQRGEAIRLLARRGVTIEGADATHERLHRFINNSATFAVPNRKAAYELTHIIFYLSEYGRRDPNLSQSAVQSLNFVGTIAHLEQNIDLLAEVCVAMRYAHVTPPKVWDTLVAQTMSRFRPAENDAGAGDDYHEFLVGNWCLAQAGAPSFMGCFNGAAQGFYSPVEQLGALRALSAALYHWEGERSGIWDDMRADMWPALGADVAAHIDQVRAASPDFDSFFAGFSRAAPTQSCGSSLHRAAHKGRR